MEYKVHLYPTVRVTIEVQASSHEEAIKFALQKFGRNPAEHLVYDEWDEGPIPEVLVDEAGDEVYLRSCLYRFDETGNPQIEE